MFAKRAPRWGAGVAQLLGVLALVLSAVGGAAASRFQGRGATATGAPAPNELLERGPCAGAAPRRAPFVPELAPVVVAAAAARGRAALLPASAARALLDHTVSYPHQAAPACPGPLVPGAALTITQSCVIHELPRRLARPGALIHGAIPHKLSMPFLMVADNMAHPLDMEIEAGELDRGPGNGVATAAEREYARAARRAPAGGAAGSRARGWGKGGAGGAGGVGGRAAASGRCPHHGGAAPPRAPAPRRRRARPQMPRNRGRAPPPPSTPPRPSPPPRPLLAPKGATLTIWHAFYHSAADEVPSSLPALLQPHFVELAPGAGLELRDACKMQTLPPAVAAAQFAQILGEPDLQAARREWEVMWYTVRGFVACMGAGAAGAKQQWGSERRHGRAGAAPASGGPRGARRGPQLLEGAAGGVSNRLGEARRAAADRGASSAPAGGRRAGRGGRAGGRRPAGGPYGAAARRRAARAAPKPHAADVRPAPPSRSRLPRRTAARGCTSTGTPAAA